jgi:hypothetical protein
MGERIHREKRERLKMEDNRDGRKDAEGGRKKG